MTEIYYDCPNCGEEIIGDGLGCDVYCDGCGKDFKTDFEYITDGIITYIDNETKTIP